MCWKGEKNLRDKGMAPPSTAPSTIPLALGNDDGCMARLAARGGSPTTTSKAFAPAALILD